MSDFVVLAGIRACDYVLVTVGFALVFGSCRVLNLMHGSYVMLGAYGTYAFSTVLIGHRVGTPMAVAGGTVLAAAANALFAFGFFKLLQITNRTRPMHVLTISVAGNLFIAKLVSYLYGTQGMDVLPMVRGTTSIGVVRVPDQDLLVPLAACLSVVGLWWWLYQTRSGTALRAVADNTSAARLMGIDSDRALAMAVAIAAFLAALAGALRAPSMTLSPDMWVHPLLVSYAVVVFGGRDSLGGAVLSATILAVAETVTAWFWNEAAAQTVALLIIVIGLFVLPRGLIGSPRYDVR